MHLFLQKNVIFIIQAFSKIPKKINFSLCCVEQETAIFDII